MIDRYPLGFPRFDLVRRSNEKSTRCLFDDLSDGFVDGDGQVLAVGDGLSRELEEEGVLVVGEKLCSVSPNGDGKPNYDSVPAGE